MHSKLIFAAFSLALLVGCVSQPKAASPTQNLQTDEQIKQKALDSTIARLKASGASQSQIDGVTAYSKLSEEDKLKSRINADKTPAENLVSLVDSGLFLCDLKRNSLKIRISYEYTIKTERELVECISTSSSVITSYYYRSYIPSSTTEAVKETVDETFLKWGAYKDSIFRSAAPLIQDQAAQSVKSQLARAQLLFLRESLKNKK